MPKLLPEAPEKKQGARATSQTVTMAKQNDGRGRYVASQTQGGERGVIHAESRSAAARSLRDVIAWVLASQYRSAKLDVGAAQPGASAARGRHPAQAKRKPRTHSDRGFGVVSESADEPTLRFDRGDREQ